MKEAEFGFVVMKNDNTDMTESDMNELLDAIIDLVEARGMSMGGGARLLDDEEADCFGVIEGVDEETPPVIGPEDFL